MQAGFFVCILILCPLTLYLKVLLTKIQEMNSREEHLDNLTEIRSLMERSSRFISLSGASGISAGIVAIIGAAAVSIYHGTSIISTAWERNYESGARVNTDTLTFYIIVALLVLGIAIALSVFFTMRKAKKNNLPVWDSVAKRLVTSLLVPLSTGGIFCIILLFNGITSLVAPSMLIFYGLALINASKFAIGDAEILGSAEIILGLTAMFFDGYGMLFWTLGFGVFHIVYGIYMYLKYER